MLLCVCGEGRGKRGRKRGRKERGRKDVGNVVVKECVAIIFK